MRKSPKGCPPLRRKLHPAEASRKLLPTCTKDADGIRPTWARVWPMFAKVGQNLTKFNKSRVRLSTCRHKSTKNGKIGKTKTWPEFGKRVPRSVELGQGSVKFGPKWEGLAKKRPKSVLEGALQRCEIEPAPSAERRSSGIWPSNGP